MARRTWEERPTRTVSKQDACLRQIHGAITMLQEGEYECAITLAGAAEGQIDDGGPETLFERLKARLSEEEKTEMISVFNAQRDWLKHVTAHYPAEIEVGEFESVILIVRAITKFNGKYGQTSPLIKDFTLWAVEHEYFDRSKLEQG